VGGFGVGWCFVFALLMAVAVKNAWWWRSHDQTPIEVEQWCEVRTRNEGRVTNTRDQRERVLVTLP